MSFLPFVLAFLTVCDLLPIPYRFSVKLKNQGVPPAKPGHRKETPEEGGEEEGGGGGGKEPVPSLLLRWGVLFKALSQHPPTLPHPPCFPALSSKGCRSAPNVPVTAGSLCSPWTQRTLKCLLGPLCHPDAGSTGGLPASGMWRGSGLCEIPGGMRASRELPLLTLGVFPSWVPAEPLAQVMCSSRCRWWVWFFWLRVCRSCTLTIKAKVKLLERIGQYENDTEQGVQSTHHSVALSRTKQQGGPSSLPQRPPPAKAAFCSGSTPLHMEIRLHWYEEANYYKRHNYKTGNGFVDAVSGRGSHSGCSGSSASRGTEQTGLLAPGALAFQSEVLLEGPVALLITGNQVQFPLQICSTVGMFPQDSSTIKITLKNIVGLKGNT